MEKIMKAMEIIADLRSQLDQWGVTNEVLMLIGAVALVAFLFSGREVIGWFLRVPHMRSELKALREQNADLKNSLDQLKVLIADEEDAENVVELKPEAASKVKAKGGRGNFRLDH